MGVGGTTSAMGVERKELLELVGVVRRKLPEGCRKEKLLQLQVYEEGTTIFGRAMQADETENMKDKLLVRRLYTGGGTLAKYFC